MTTRSQMRRERNEPRRHAYPSGPGDPDRPIPWESGAAAGDIKLKRPWDALQLHRPDLGECHWSSVRPVDDLLADQHLALSGVLGDPCRDVHGSAEVVPFLEDHRPRVDPNMRRWKAVAPDHLHHLNGGEHGISRLWEVEHHTIAQPLHGRSSVLLRGPPH